MTGDVVPCPVCKSPLAAGRSICDGCSVYVRLDGDRAIPIFPDVRPGAIITSHDLSRSRPIGVPASYQGSNGAIRSTSTSEGQLVEVADANAYRCGIWLVRRRDVSVRASFVAYEPSTLVALFVRCELVGEANTSYALYFHPSRASARLYRRVGWKTSHLTPLTDWLPAPGLTASGPTIDVELRAFGATLEGLVSGKRVLAVHDPVLGVGYPGVLVEGFGGPARCLWRGIEVREVAV